MKSIPRSLGLLLTLAVLVPMASAQGSSQGAANASAAAERSNAAANAHQAAAAANKTASAATSNATAATTAAGASIPTTKGTVNAGIANSATPPGHRATRHPGDAPGTSEPKVHGTAKAPGLLPDGHPRGNISATLNSQATAAHIRNATKASREKVFADVDASVEVSRRSLAETRQQARELRKEAREEFKSAAEEVRVREKALRESLKAARKASDDNSAAAQARLASDYEGYAAAVARTESALREASPPAPGARP